MYSYCKHCIALDRMRRLGIREPLLTGASAPPTSEVPLPHPLSSFLIRNSLAAANAARGRASSCAVSSRSALDIDVVLGRAALCHVDAGGVHNSPRSLYAAWAAACGPACRRPQGHTAPIAPLGRRRALRGPAPSLWLQSALKRPNPISELGRFDLDLGTNERFHSGRSMDHSEL